MQDRIYPNEQEFAKQSHAARGANGVEWTHPPLLVELMVEAKQRGLWNLFLPVDSAELAPEGAHLGRGLTNLQSARPSGIVSSRGGVETTRRGTAAAGDASRHRRG